MQGYLLVCTAAFSLTDEVSYQSFVFFLFSTSPQSQHHICLLFASKCVTCRWAFETPQPLKTPHKAKGESRAPLFSTLVSFGSIPAPAAGDSFSLVFDEVLIAKKLCCFFSLLTNFHVVATKFITKANFKIFQKRILKRIFLKRNYYYYYYYYYYWDALRKHS